MRSTLLLLFLVACARPPAPRVATIYLGSSCGDSTASKAPVIRRATVTDTALARTGQAGLLIIVDSSTSDRPLARALARVKGTTNGAFANDSGQALLSRMHDGSASLVIRKMAFTTWEGDVPVRAGYRDTLEVGLGAGQLCLLSSRRERY
jgi:hypothetical protein